MENFFKGVLVALMLIIGYASIYYYGAIHGFYWYHLLLGLGSNFLTMPALVWWKNYFDNI